MMAQIRCFIFAPLLACLLSNCLASAAAFDYEVKIDAPAEMRALLENNLDLLRWRGNARIDADQLQRLYRAAPLQVKTLLATEGYYTPTISQRLDKSGPLWRVDLTVEPGAPVRVAEIDLILQGFAGHDEQRDALRANWSLPKGAIFRQAEWEKAKRDVLRQALANHFPRAQLRETSATVDPEKHQAALKVVIDSGPLFLFDGLRIEGLRRYPDSIVANLNQIKPGDEYSEAALLALQTSLQDSGYFSVVTVTANINGDNPDGEKESTADANAPGTAIRVPVLLGVIENPKKKVGLGIGYSTNTGNRAQLGYDDLSLFGLKLKSEIVIETKKQSAHGDLYFPISPHGDHDSIGASFERSDIANEVTSTSSIAAKRSWGNQAVERSVTLEYVNEHKIVAGLPQSHSQSLPLTYELALRRVDSLLFPNNGYVLHAQIGGAPLPLLTSQIFVRVSARMIVYRPLGERGKLILRGEIGALASKNKSGIPAAYLFRAGGDQSVRGYAYRQLGIREGDAIVGARYLTALSAEYQYWPQVGWGGAVFYDLGNAVDVMKDLQLKSGYGIGARWKSPVGPINLDVAYGHAVKEYRMHFSLGFTF